jgi:CRP-like cAMP-binding protein
LDEALLRHPIFEGADTGALSAVIDGVRTRWVPKGTMLATPGGAPRAVLLVLEGRLRSFLLTPDGRRVILELVGAGGIDGLIPTVGLAGHFTDAVDKTLLASVSPIQLERMVRADPTVAVNLVAIATRRLAVRETQLETLALRDPGRRIAGQLLHLARIAHPEEDGAEPVQLGRGLTHQVIADMSGIRRETVTLHLQRLAQAGAVLPGDGLQVMPDVLAAIVAGRIRLAARRRQDGGDDDPDDQ